MAADDNSFPEPTGRADHASIFAALRHLDRRMDEQDRNIGSVMLTLGKESDDGKGGTGLVGEVRRMHGHVGSLLTDRNILRGVLATIVATGTLLLLGVRQWLHDLQRLGQ